MTIKQLYIITRPDGGQTVTPRRPSEEPYELGGKRLIATLGLILALAADPSVIVGPCLDVPETDVPLYTEVPDPGPEEEPPEEEEEPAP